MASLGPGPASSQPLRDEARFDPTRTGNTTFCSQTGRGQPVTALPTQVKEATSPPVPHELVSRFRDFWEGLGLATSRLWMGDGPTVNHSISKPGQPRPLGTRVWKRGVVSTFVFLVLSLALLPPGKRAKLKLDPNFQEQVYPRPTAQPGDFGVVISTFPCPPDSSPEEQVPAHIQHLGNGVGQASPTVNHSISKPGQPRPFGTRVWKREVVRTVVNLAFLSLALLPPGKKAKLKQDLNCQEQVYSRPTAQPGEFGVVKSTFPCPPDSSPEEQFPAHIQHLGNGIGQASPTPLRFQARATQAFRDPGLEKGGCRNSCTLFWSFCSPAPGKKAKHKQTTNVRSKSRPTAQPGEFGSRQGAFPCPPDSPTPAPRSKSLLTLAPWKGSWTGHPHSQPLHFQARATQAFRDPGLEKGGL
jgi:hypothetical protein